jgi:EamA domain-containing membrane protein RarD
MTDSALTSDPAAIRRAVILSFFGNAAFSAQYALMQLAGKSVSAPMIIAVNATLLLLVVGAASVWRGHKLYFKTAYPRQQTWRCLLRVAANATGIWALLHIPLTTHIVLGFLSPLLVAIIGPMMLREARVQKAVVSVALGLAGMFIILSVETAPLVPLLVAFAGVVIGSLNGILVRTMPRHSSSRLSMNFERF